MKIRFLTTILMLCLGISHSYAQAIIQSVTETNDFIPAADQRRDYNNQLCALVKVQVVDEITDIEGNVMGDIVNYGVEKWVYMAQGSRNMKIHFKNNLPLTLQFRNFDINGLKGNRVYEIVIEIPNASTPSSPNEHVQAKVNVEDTELPKSKETQKTEITTTKKWKNLFRKNKSQTNYHNSIVKEQKHKPSTNKEKVVVFGIRAGGNLASLSLDGDADGKCSMVMSFHAGLNMDVRLTNQLHLNTSLLFSQKGYKYEHDWDYERDETAKAQFVMLPVQLSFRIGKIQINAGPYVEYGFGGEIEYGRGWTYDTFDYYKALNYGITAGAGFSLDKHFYLGTNYEMGLSDYANRNIAISFGYNF